MFKTQTLNSRLLNVFAAAALVIVLAFVIRLGVATNELARSEGGQAAVEAQAPEQGVPRYLPGQVAGYRQPTNECYDVPISEAAACRGDVEAPASHWADTMAGYRQPPYECYDAPLSEAAACRAGSEAHAQTEAGAAGVYRKPLGPCFDVPLGETTPDC